MIYIIVLLAVLNIAQYIYHYRTVKKMHYNLARRFFHNELAELDSEAAAKTRKPERR